MGILKLGSMTLGGLFKKPETLKYPFEEKEPYSGQKGFIKHSDKTKCNLCGMCSKRCPCGAIEVNRKEQTWTINHFQCIQCGYCVMTCPKKCLMMDGHKPSVAAKKDSDIVSVPQIKKAAVKKDNESAKNNNHKDTKTE